MVKGRCIKYLINEGLFYKFFTENVADILINMMEYPGASDRTKNRADYLMDLNKKTELSKDEIKSCLGFLEDCMSPLVANSDNCDLSPKNGCRQEVSHFNLMM